MTTLTAPVATLVEIINSDALWTGEGAVIVEERNPDAAWTGKGVNAPAADVQVTTESIDLIMSAASQS